ncbi:MAG: undecaprenyl-diphosphate phosphatase [Gammaproteobacteria bacterium]|nr:undecaprenyl-diphosphate phosphatase [Gammaproteobacteria bacterium]
MEPSLIQIVVLALIQGVTEFLPVSSSAHLILPAALTDWPDQGLAFDAAVHLGTLVAVMAYFRRDLGGFATSGLAFVRHRVWDGNLDLGVKVLVATIPVVVAGVAFKAQIETHLRSTTVIALATIVFGIVLWLADRRRGTESVDLPSYTQAVLIGLAQALALVPGTSRAGITIAAALALGLGRRGAARFSFMLAIPAIIGACIYTLVDADDLAGLPWVDLGLGFVIAALSAFACVSAFLRFVERTGMTPYVVYRILLGVVLLTFFA